MNTCIIGAWHFSRVTGYYSDKYMRGNDLVGLEVETENIYVT